MTKDVNDRRSRYIVTDIAGQSIFDIGFPLAVTTGVAVYVDGDDVMSSDYTVDLDDLTVTFSVAVPQNSIVTIEGNRPIERIENFPLNGDLRSSKLNNDFDATIEIAQELRRDLDRTIRLNKAESDIVSNQLPLLSQGKTIIWGDEGLENGPDGDDLAQAQVYAEQVAADKILVENYKNDAQAAQAAAEAAASGVSYKESVVAATTANITLSGEQTIDGIAVVTSDRVLVKNQTNPYENGVYICAAGAWSRSSDLDDWVELISSVIGINGGTINEGLNYICTIGAGGTIDVDDITFSFFTGIGIGSITTPKLADEAVTFLKINSALQGNDVSLGRTDRFALESAAKTYTDSILGAINLISDGGINLGNAAKRLEVRIGSGTASSRLSGTIISPAFTTPFTNGCLFVLAIGEKATGSGGRFYFQTASKSTTGFTAELMNPGNVSNGTAYTYIAVGY